MMYVCMYIVYVYDVCMLMYTERHDDYADERSKIISLMREMKAELQSMGFLAKQIDNAMDACPVYDLKESKRALISWILAHPLTCVLSMCLHLSFYILTLKNTNRKNYVAC